MCPLCGETRFELFDKDKLRNYYECKCCHLVYVPRNELISQQDEKNRYDAHENSGSGYDEYIHSIILDILPHLKAHTSGLDYGCGKSKSMEEGFSRSGFKVSSYDLYFHPDSSLLCQKYDFIIMSEVIEHVRDLEVVMTQIRQMLNQGGQIFMKTKCLPETGFSNWFYKRDITHIQFFNPQSFEKLSELYKLGDVEEIGKDLYLFQTK